MAYEVRYDPVALAALEETFQYVREQSGDERAGRWLDAVRSGIEKLETSPRAFAVSCMRRGRPIHSKPVVGHRVFYLVDEPTQIVYVLDVVHGARETRLAEFRDAEG